MSVSILLHFHLFIHKVHLLLPLRGEVMNGGFGLLLDGTEEAARRARLMLNWDVSNGVSLCCSLSSGAQMSVE